MSSGLSSLASSASQFAAVSTLLATGAVIGAGLTPSQVYPLAMFGLPVLQQMEVLPQPSSTAEALAVYASAAFLRVAAQNAEIGNENGMIKSAMEGAEGAMQTTFFWFCTNVVVDRALDSLPDNVRQKYGVQIALVKRGLLPLLVNNGLRKVFDTVIMKNPQVQNVMNLVTEKFKKSPTETKIL